MQKYGHQKTEKFSIWLMIPIFLVSAIIPLIVRMKSYQTHLESFDWYTATGSASDFFLYYKAMFLIITAVIMLGVIVCRLYVNGIESFKSKYLIPVAAYAVLIILSFIFSQNKTFSTHGIMDQFESVFVLLAYCICVFYTFSVVESEKAVKAVIYGLLSSAAVMSFIGFTQFIKKDFFATQFAKYLYLPSSYWANSDSIQFTMAPGQVYLSLYNPNYVGSYAVLVAPLLLAAFFVTKNKIMKAVFALVEVGVMVCLIGSWSKTGLVLMIFVLFLMPIAFRKKIWQHKKFAIPGIVVLVGLFLAYDFSSHHLLLTRFKQIESSMKTVQTFDLEEIRTGQESVEIDYAGNTLKASYELQEGAAMNFSLYDGDGNAVAFGLSEDGSKVLVTDERFPFTLVPTQISDGVYCMGITIPKYKAQAGSDSAETNTWYFSNDVANMSGYAYYTPYGKFVKMENAEHMFFEDKGGFADGRGYIWSRTFPLLKKYWLFGSGPDTFLLVFPQMDYVSAYNNGYYAKLISKPHNIFLQIGVQTGIPSLIAYLLFYIIYFIGSVRLYWKDQFDNYLSPIGVSICLGTLGYLLTGMLNDSSTTLAPIYWVMMGLGIAVNALVVKERKNAAAEAERVEIISGKKEKKESKNRTEETSEIPKKETPAKERESDSKESKKKSHSRKKKR